MKRQPKISLKEIFVQNLSFKRKHSNEPTLETEVSISPYVNFDDEQEQVYMVMFDGSALPFKENVMQTRTVAEYAHAHGVSIEGELGTIGGTEEGISVSENDKKYTNRVWGKS